MYVFVRRARKEDGSEHLEREGGHRREKGKALRDLIQKATKTIEIERERSYHGWLRETIIDFTKKNMLMVTLVDLRKHIIDFISKHTHQPKVYLYPLTP